MSLLLFPCIGAKCDSVSGALEFIQAAYAFMRHLNTLAQHNAPEVALLDASTMGREEVVYQIVAWVHPSGRRGH